MIDRPRNPPRPELGAPWTVADGRAARGQRAASRYSTFTRPSYRALIASNPRHRIGRAAPGPGVLLYVFVAVQLAWVLRPFVGSPNVPTRFFRASAWSNAYVVVIDETGRSVGYGGERR